MSSNRLLRALHLAAAFVLVLGGCSQDRSGDSRPRPTVDSFAASPATVDAGGKSALSWKTSHATAIRLTAGGEPIELGGRRPSEGSIEVRPAHSTIYELAAIDASGQATRTVEVTVAPLPGAPRIESFRAEPEEIAAGGTSRLAWSVAGADSVTIRDHLGNALDFDPAAASVEVAPRGDTLYTLEARNRGGTATAEARAIRAVDDVLANLELPEVAAVVRLDRKK